MGLGSVASAEPTSRHSGGANAVQIGVVRIDPKNPRVAYVTGRHKCPAGFAHLFVSVKQVADGSPDSRLKLEGSSSISSGWLERHPGPNEFTCDGTWHTAHGESRRIRATLITKMAMARRLTDLAHSFLGGCTCSSVGTVRIGTRTASSSPTQDKRRQQTNLIVSVRVGAPRIGITKR